jgi:hypothetical protein
MNGETENANLDELADESLEIEISEDDDEETEAPTGRNDQAEDIGLSFKEISEEWKMVAWFTESICVRYAWMRLSVWGSVCSRTIFH